MKCTKLSQVVPLATTFIFRNPGSGSEIKPKSAKTCPSIRILLFLDAKRPIRVYLSCYVTNTVFLSFITS